MMSQVCQVGASEKFNLQMRKPGQHELRSWDTAPVSLEPKLAHQAG